MTLTTNCNFLENELLDAARLFERRPDTIEHRFHFEDGVFCNALAIDGKEYSFCDSAEAEDELTFKRLERRFAKLHLYEILSELYDERMPWGALTGIRPTKLAYAQIEETGEFETLFAQMHVSKENTELVKRVLQTQEGIYQKKDGNTDFFVSLPFCPTKCAYCSFITAPIEKTRAFLPAYLTCLEKEIAAAKESVGNLRSIYIGGGTPFALSVEQLERVLVALQEIYALKEGVEYTVEAGRPDVFSVEKLELLKKYGVNRICINPQTFSNETLQKIGRKHTVEDFYRAYEMCKDFDFLVNIDLIAGLQGESVEQFASGVKQAVSLGADNITVHCLSLKSGAKLKEEQSYIKGDRVSLMIEKSREILSNSGYLPYYMYRQKYQAGNNENVGWCKKGTACVYNVDVMEETADNLAVGANAISKRVFTKKGAIERLASQKDLQTYMQNVDLIIEKKREFFK